MNKGAEPTQEREQSHDFMNSAERQGGRRSQILEAEGIFADSTESIIRSFAIQRAARSEIKQPVGHIPISFSPEDSYRMTNEFMMQLAHEYMQEMGIDNTQYVVVRHHNTDHDHLHIVYNRIDNDLKLISVNNDYKRNIEVCKKLKDRHSLTYGKGKDKVNRQKLNNPDAVRYLLYDIIKAILPYCTSEKEFQNYLQSNGVNVEFKQRRTTGEIEGISFNYDNISFKGSQVDRKFSYGNLQKAFDENKKMYDKKLAEFDIRKFMPDEPSKKAPQSKPLEQLTPNVTTPQKPKPEGSKIPKIGGVTITDQQWVTLKEGGNIYLEGMKMQSGKIISAYVFMDDQQQKVLQSTDNPDKLVKYGKWEIRIRDKILIEMGFIVHAKIKWYGGGEAHPYLWKPGVVDEKSVEIKVIDDLVSGNYYRGSWSDPRKAAQEITQKQEKDSLTASNDIGTLPEITTNEQEKVSTMTSDSNEMAPEITTNEQEKVTNTPSNNNVISPEIVTNEQEKVTNTPSNNNVISPKTTTKEQKTATNML